MATHIYIVQPFKHLFILTRAVAPSTLESLIFGKIATPFGINKEDTKVWLLPVFLVTAGMADPVARLCEQEHQSWLKVRLSPA